MSVQRARVFLREIDQSLKETHDDPLYNETETLDRGSVRRETFGRSTGSPLQILG